MTPPDVFALLMHRRYTMIQLHRLSRYAKFYVEKNAGINALLALTLAILALFGGV